MTSHLYYLINQFLQWPIQTKIELGFSNLNFPAVTICNVNPIRNSKVYMASEHLQSLLAQLETTSLYGDANAEVCLHLVWVYIRSNKHCTSMTQITWKHWYNLYTGFVQNNVTRIPLRVSLVEQKLLTPGFCGVRVVRSLVLCVCFVDSCLSFLFWP